MKRVKSILPCGTLILCINTNPLLAAAEQGMEEVRVQGQQVDISYLNNDSNTALRLPISLLETPQSVSIISRNQIDDYQLETTRDALNSATGIYVEEVETDRTYYKARGFDITNFQLDGVGLPFTSGNTHGEMDTAIYEQIDILRGANGLLTNSGNPSATINFIRKRPTEDLQLALSATAGSWDKYRMTADASGSVSESVNARLVLVKQNNNSYLREYEQDKSLAYGVVDVRLSENTLLSLGHSTEINEADSPLWGALPLYYSDGSATDYDVDTSTSADWSYWNTNKQQSFVELSHQLANGWLLKATYNHLLTDEDSELFYVYGVPDATTEAGLNGWASEYDFNEQQRIADIYASGKYSLFGKEHDLMLGLNWSDSHYRDSSLYDYSTGNGFPVIPNLNTWNGNSPRPTFADGRTGSEVSMDQQSAYAATRINVSDQFSTLIGARLNTIEIDGTSYGVDQSTKHSDELTPYVGLVYQPASNISLYASYAEIFSPQQEVDINRKPIGAVTGDNKELGIKGEFFGGKLLSSLAWFDVEQSNLAVAAGIIPGTVDTYYRGAEGISSKGYELELIGALTENLQTTLGLTKLSINGDDTVKDYTPDTLVRLATSYRLPQVNQVKLGMAYNWQSKTTRDQGFGITTKQDSYGVLNAFVNYQINKNLSVSLNGNNLTDEKYLSSLYWAQAYYQAPRNYSISVDWQL